MAIRSQCYLVKKTVSVSDTEGTDGGGVAIRAAAMMENFPKRRRDG